jgi:hypothetical protein
MRLEVPRLIVGARCLFCLVMRRIPALRVEAVVPSAASVGARQTSRRCRECRIAACDDAVCAVMCSLVRGSAGHHEAAAGPAARLRSRVTSGDVSELRQTP